MAINRTVLVARLLWTFPALLFFLTIDQTDAALDLRETLSAGQPAVAEVVAIHTTDRVDVTMASAELRIRRKDGGVDDRELPLPITFARELEGRDSLEVRMMAGADQEIVISELGRAQWRLAAANAGMSFIGFVLLFVGVFAWNRYLRQKGDPARRRAEEAV